MDASTTRKLRTGRPMPVMGLGTWKLTNHTADTVDAAIDAGYRMIDTAVDYGSQRGIGKGIRQNGIARSDLFLVTKIEEDDDPLGAMNRDLGEIGLEYADLTLIHRPPDTGVGEDLWRGLIAARDDGLVRDIGVSNYTAEQIDRLVDATGEVPAVNQVEWTPFGHSDALLRHHDDNGITLQAYSPLTRAERLADEALQRVAGRYGKSPAQVLIRWNLQRGTVPLPKANRPEHFLENLDVFDFEIDDEDMQRLEALDENYSALGALPYA